MKKAVIRIFCSVLSILLVIGIIPSYAYAQAAAPTSLSYTVEEGYSNNITLSWMYADGAAGYKIYQSADGINYSFVDSSYDTSYDFYAGFAKGIYYYYVTAIHYIEVERQYSDSYGGTYSYYDYVEQESAPSNTVAVPVYDNTTVYCYTSYNDNYDGIDGIEWSYSFDNANEPIEKYIDGFCIYRSDNNLPWQLEACIPASSYSKIDGDYADYMYRFSQALSPGSYKLLVCTYANLGGVFYCNPDFSRYDEFNVYMPEPVLTTKTKSQIIKWEKLDGAEYYEIWQSKSGKKAKRVATVPAGKTSYTVKKVNNYKYDYSYYVVCVKNGIEACRTYTAYSSDSQARMRAATKKKKNKSSVTVVNTRPAKTTTAWTVSLSKSDKKTLDKFAKKHFKKGWTKAQKAEYTLNWINKNVKYAKGSGYNKIAGCSYVDAIFNKKLGQCLQYNGAYAMFLTYLGYDARIVQGWRGSNMKNKWSHYWCEINIDGKWYLMETGNFDDSGDWMYFCASYRNSRGYLINTKPAEKL